MLWIRLSSMIWIIILWIFVVLWRAHTDTSNLLWRSRLGSVWSPSPLITLTASGSGKPILGTIVQTMWGEPDRASIRETLMTDNIHVASWTTTPSDTQTTIRQQKYAHAAGWHYCPLLYVWIMVVRVLVLSCAVGCPLSSHYSLGIT